MAIQLNIKLTDDQKSQTAQIPASHWFSPVVFRNAESPVHPNRVLAENNEMNMEMVSDWVARAAKGKRVLGLFSANGGFSIFSALHGA